MDHSNLQKLKCSILPYSFAKPIINSFSKLSTDLEVTQAYSRHNVDINELIYLIGDFMPGKAFCIASGIDFGLSGNCLTIPIDEIKHVGLYFFPQT